MVFDPESITRRDPTMETTWADSPDSAIDDDTNPWGIQITQGRSLEHPVIIGTTVVAQSPNLRTRSAYEDTTSNGIVEHFEGQIADQPEVLRAEEKRPEVRIVLPPPPYASPVLVRPRVENPKEPELSRDMTQQHAAIEYSGEEVDANGVLAKYGQAEPIVTETSDSEPKDALIGKANDISAEHTQVPLIEKPKDPQNPIQTRNIDATKRKLALAAHTSRNIVDRTSHDIGAYIGSWWEANKAFAIETTYIHPRANPEKPNPNLGRIRKIGALAVYGAKNMGSFSGFALRNTPIVFRRAARFAYLPATFATTVYALGIARNEKGMAQQLVDYFAGGLTILSLDRVNRRRETNESPSNTGRLIGAAVLSKMTRNRNKSQTDRTEAISKDEAAPSFIPARVASEEQSPKGEVLDAKDLQEFVSTN